MDKIKVLKDWINESDNIVFLTGAGVSTPSGIPDFRGKDGIYSEKFQGRWNNVFEISSFTKDPSDYYDFYKSSLGDFKPNIIHEKIAELEKADKEIYVVTQNIDGLHQLAGSKNVLELHGSAKRSYCMKCLKEYNMDEYNLEEPVPYCSCGGVIRPDVVMFGEGLDQNVLYKSIEKIRNSDLLVVAGTSLTVHPAAGLVNYYIKDKMVIINNQETPYDIFANLVINDDLVDVVFKI